MTDKERIGLIKKAREELIKIGDCEGNGTANMNAIYNDMGWLVEQAERALKNAEDIEIMDRQLASEQKRIMELEKELEDLRFIYSTMNGKRIRYKKALEFYADKNTWYQKHIKQNEYEAPIALRDEGRIARKALGIGGSENE